MKRIVKTSFWQLFVIYSLIVLALSLGFLWKYSFQFNVFALVIALIGAYTLSNRRAKEEIINAKLHKAIFWTSIALIVILRIIPYIGNSVPLGYDPGIYKYGMEHGLENLDNWILSGGLEPGFLYLMAPLHTIFSSDLLLTYGLIVFSVLLGLTLYITVKEYFDKNTALIALALFALSAIQFKTFWYMYYKNIIGMSLMLLAFYFLKKSEQKKNWVWAFILTGAVLASVHRPSFYIFGLSYFIWAFISPIKKEYRIDKLTRNAIAGAILLALAIVPYLGKFSKAITIMFEPVLQGFTQPGESAGTFINFFTFQFSILPYLVLALLGLFMLIKRKKFNILVIWAVINFVIVYFQFFFFNRFIIFLDLAFIIMASVGIMSILNQENKIGKAILIVLVLSAGIIAVQESVKSQPLISEQELEQIKQFNTTPEEAYAMSTNKHYSPWILGYSERKTIAPGLFDYDNSTIEQWQKFWETDSFIDAKNFMDNYPKPVYVYVGPIQEDNLAKIRTCFSVYSNSSGGTIYKYEC